MYVQNGDRPQWAWSGQHVEVASGWELRSAPQEAANGSAAGPPPVELLGEASGRPSWAWGAERAAAAAAAPAPELARPVAPAVTASSEDRPAWSWGGGAVA
ncbi:MAG TPA: hypothetical protein VGP96_15170 [Candidatus Dormibacteraeota bacterium]|jgi:hypothetical protein|nr:hypothetical protein [Candidatus Dormibacteraeota bacterium]